MTRRALARVFRRPGPLPLWGHLVVTGAVTFVLVMWAMALLSEKG